MKIVFSLLSLALAVAIAVPGREETKAIEGLLDEIESELGKRAMDNLTTAAKTNGTLVDRTLEEGEEIIELNENLKPELEEMNQRYKVCGQQG